MIVDASPVKYITTDGKCLDGSSTRRGNYKFHIDFKTVTFLKFNTCKDWLGNKTIALIIGNKSNIQVFNEVANMKKKNTDNEATAVGKMRYKFMLMGEYENICDVTLTNDVKHYSYQDFHIIQRKVLSSYATCMNNRTVVIKPCDISSDEKKT